MGVLVKDRIQCYGYSYTRSLCHIAYVYIYIILYVYIYSSILILLYTRYKAIISRNKDVTNNYMHVERGSYARDVHFKQDSSRMRTAMMNEGEKAYTRTISLEEINVSTK